MVKRLRRRPLTAETGVRFPMGLPHTKGVPLRCAFCVCRPMVESNPKQRNALWRCVAWVRAFTTLWRECRGGLSAAFPYYIISESLLLSYDTLVFSYLYGAPFVCVAPWLNRTPKQSNALSTLFRYGIMSNVLNGIILNKN